MSFGPPAGPTGAPAALLLLHFARSLPALDDDLLVALLLGLLDQRATGTTWFPEVGRSPHGFAQGREL